MISIALVLILMIGVNRVFKYTTDTVGTQAAVSSAMRDLRAGERSMRHDFDASVSSSEQPAIIIRSRVVYAFRNKQDQLTAVDPNNPQWDVDPLNSAASIDFSSTTALTDGRIPAELPSDRRHRLDNISFFARDISNPFKRQTGDAAAGAGTLMFNTSSTEAWITYGPLWLPDNTGTFSTVGSDPTANPPIPPPTYPGVGTAATNPNNYYASQFLLGRQVILLKSFADMPDQDSYLVGTGGSGAKALSPLGFDTPVRRKTGTTSGTFNSSVTSVIETGNCDLADATIASFRDTVTAVAGVNWWLPLATNGTQAQGQDPFLFQADPVGVRSSSGGVTGDTAYKSSSVFMSNVSQFIVEYAGDFLTQSELPANAGQVTAAKPDGVIDFVRVPGTGAIPERRMIQWYGYPRDVGGPAPTFAKDNVVTPTDGDVCPVQTFATAPGNTVTNAPGNCAFEREIVAIPPPAASSTPHPYYTVAFRSQDFDGTGYPLAGARKPSLIRIIIQIADPAGRLQDGQNFEYVFAVK